MSSVNKTPSHAVRRAVRLARLAGGLAAATFAVTAHAGYSTDFGLHLDAFGTLGGIYSDYDKADYVTDSYAHPHGAGYTRSFSMDQDTKLGVQLTTPLWWDKLTATVQVVSEQRYNGKFTPQFEWANLKYQIDSEWSVRVGRVLAPTYITSETQKVGYANYWARTPAEVAIGLPIPNIDGIDVSYERSFGEVSNRLEMLYGVNKEQVPYGITYANTQIYAAADVVQYGAATLHLGFQKMYYTYAADSVVDPQKERYEAFEVGLTYDPGKFYLTGEIFNGQDQYAGHFEQWYAGGGYRLGTVTLYAARSNIEQATLGTWGAYPLFQQNTSMAGVRWDFYKNLDLKVQVDRTQIGSLMVPTSFINVQPSAKIGDHADIISAMIDFVW